jgi:hypothetical protein
LCSLLGKFVIANKSSKMVPSCSQKLSSLSIHSFIHSCVSIEYLCDHTRHISTSKPKLMQNSC